MQKTIKWPQYVAGLSAAGGAVAVGTALGWPAPAGPRMVVEGGNDRFFEITQREFDWVGSMITIGCAVSCLPIGILMKKYGRKWTMISLVVPFMIGWGLVIWSQNFIMLLIGRFMLGLAGGAFCVSAPQYAAEIAEKEIRGIIGTFFQVLTNLGILLAYVLGSFMSVFWMSVVCAIVPLVFGGIFFFMPESPVYLVIENRDDEARITFKWLRGEDYDPQSEIDELKRELEQNQSTISFGEVLKRRSAQRALFIGFGLMVFLQFCGINIVVFNATAIFEAAQTDINSDVQTIIIGAVLLLATLLGTALVDKLGRKKLLIISSFFMGLMLVTLGFYFFLLDAESDAIGSLGWLPLTSLCIYLIAFSIGFGPIPWLIMSEIYSRDYNAIASPITGSFVWLFAFTITSTFGFIVDAIGMGQTFWLFAGLTFLGIFFIMFVVVETKAKTMLEIQQMLGGEKTLLK